MDDSDWMFDLISQFLRSPYWRNPIQTYIDENCILFDVTEENPLNLTEVHRGFCELIDSILQRHLTELGISSEQFITACEKGKNNDELNNLVSEYILALDDFSTFKTMMSKRNIELELEALQALHRSNPFAETGESETAEERIYRDQQEEKELLELAIAASIQDEDVHAKLLEMETAQLEHAIAISLQLQKEVLDKNEKTSSDKVEAASQIEVIQKSFEVQTSMLPSASPVCDPEATVKSVKAPVVFVQNAPVVGERPSTSQSSTLACVRQHRLAAFDPSSRPALPDIGKANPAVLSSPSRPVVASASSPSKPSEEDIAKRKEYLKQQRDLLLASKREERAKETAEYEKSQGKKPVATSTSLSESTSEPVDEQQRQMRLALGKRFKEDLIQEARVAATRGQKQS